MELPFDEREGGEVVGMVTKSAAASEKVTADTTNSPTSSDSSKSSSSSSESTVSFEDYVATMDGTNNDVTDSTGQMTSAIFEDESVVVAENEEVEKGGQFEEPKDHPSDITENENEGSNGHQENGSGVIDFPPENGNGAQEVDVGSNGQSFSKSPDSTVGLKFVESLWDESSSNVSVTTPEVNNGEQNVVSRIIKIDHTGSPEKSVPEVEEFDVERVIQKQETHNLYCPDCKSCITRRVILRRKRKLKEISSSEDPPSSITSQAIPPLDDNTAEGSQETAPPQSVGTRDTTVDAITCLSCFSIFIPTRNGFLSWRFGRKSDASDGTSTVPQQVNTPSVEDLSFAGVTGTDGGEASADASVEDYKGFSTWMLTCCQPSWDEKKPGLPETPGLGVGSLTDSSQEIAFSAENPVVPGEVKTDGTESSSVAPMDDGMGTGSSTESSHEIGLSAEEPSLPGEQKGDGVASAPLEDGKGFSSWFLTCCQPSLDGSKPKLPDTPDKKVIKLGAKPDGKEVLEHETEPSSIPSDVGTSMVSSQEITPSADEPKLPKEVNTDGAMTTSSAQIDDDIAFSSWFATCCQPSANGSKTKRPEIPVTGTQEDEIEAPLLSTDDGVSTKPPQGIATPVGDPSLPGNFGTEVADSLSNAPKDDDTGKGFPLWFLTCCQPADVNRPKFSVKLEIPDPPLKYEPPNIPDAGTSVPETSSHHEILDGSTDTQSPSKLVPDSADGTRDILLPPKPIPDVTPGSGSSDPPQPQPQPPAAGAPDAHESRVIMPVTEPQPAVTEPDVDPHAVGPIPDIERPLLGECPRPRDSGLDITKAIVFGGLLECIASLSVIASAAGGDATTLNIVALGVANVFAGFIVLFHNLKELKNQQNTPRYEDELGRPGHFLLHAFLAFVSYLVFGFLPPVIYGFTFRKSDNKDYKILTLAAVSFVCITILSTAKAYVQRPPKAYIKTIFYYLTLGVSVAGLGYVAGDLVNEGLKKLGIFDSNAPVTNPVLLAGAMIGQWSSY